MNSQASATDLLLSRSAYAARRGIGVSALSNYFARGKLTPECLTRDGKIIVAIADAQLGDTLDPSRSVGQVIARPEAPQAPVPAPAPIGSMANVKLQQAELELRRQLEAAEERRGRYVLADAIRREHTREIVQLIATIEQRLPELVAAIAGIEGKAAVVAARRWWRGLRQAEASAARDRADAAPEFEIDAPAPAAHMDIAHAA